MFHPVCSSAQVTEEEEGGLMDQPPAAPSARLALQLQPQLPPSGPESDPTPDRPAKSVLAAPASITRTFLYLLTAVESASNTFTGSQRFLTCARIQVLLLTCRLSVGWPFQSDAVFIYGRQVHMHYSGVSEGNSAQLGYCTEHAADSRSAATLWRHLQAEAGTAA